jgi:putative oxidoreductase
MSPRKLLIFEPLPVRFMAGIAFIVAGLPKFENISINQGFLLASDSPLITSFLLLF